METNLRLKCRDCGCWNRFRVKKIFIEKPTSEPKVTGFIPMYKPLQVVKCKKCGKIMAEPTVLIRITSSKT